MCICECLCVLSDRYVELYAVCISTPSACQCGVVEWKFIVQVCISIPVAVHRDLHISFRSCVYFGTVRSSGLCAWVVVCEMNPVDVFNFRKY